MFWTQKTAPFFGCVNFEWQCLSISANKTTGKGVSTHICIGKSKMNCNSWAFSDANIVLCYAKLANLNLRILRSMTFLYFVELLILRTRRQWCMNNNWSLNVLKYCAVFISVILIVSSRLYRWFFYESSTNHQRIINKPSMKPHWNINVSEFSPVKSFMINNFCI